MTFGGKGQRPALPGWSRTSTLVLGVMYMINKHFKRMEITHDSCDVAMLTDRRLPLGLMAAQAAARLDMHLKF